MSKSSDLVFRLEEAANIVRLSGDVHSDYFDNSDQFAAEIEYLALLVSQSGLNPFKIIRAQFARKKAKYTWASPSFDLDDYLAGHPNSIEIGNAIYEML
jgi:hypothetical protein